MVYRLRFLAGLALLWIVLSVVITPALAQAKPFLTLSPVWRPGTQLVTVDTNGTGFPHFDFIDPTVHDDYRYVDIEFYVQGNVQFWAADITCTINKAALGSYTPDPTQSITPKDLGDDVAMVRWGPAWGTSGQFAEVPAVPGNGQGFNSSTGTITFTASRQGNVPPLGSNGANYSLLLATVRFRVPPLLANTTSTLTCSSMNFLDRNGVVVTKPALAKIPPLNIFTGYTLSGKVKYQALASSLGIGVTCDTVPTSGSPIAVTTDSTGAFKIPNLRKLGAYSCTYRGNVLTPGVGSDADAFLAGGTKLFLNNPSYTLYPTMLYAGNTQIGADPQTVDVGAVTSNWHTTQLPFTNGDTNGDKKVDQIDLAIVMGNYGLNEAAPNNTTMYTHVIYSLPRDYNVLSNSHLWLGTPNSGAVTPLLGTTTRDFWPATSPDGTKIAFTRFDTKTGHYGLFIAPTAGGTATKLTPATFTLDAFAPSWSPDGVHIAFVAAGNDPNTGDGYFIDHGDIYVVDTDGRNFSLAAGKSRIYPPAWFNDTVLVYAGYGPYNLAPNLPYNHDCPNTLCYRDFAANKPFKVAPQLDFGGLEVVDMPVIRFVGSSPPDAYLFYRHSDGLDPATRTIRAAWQITYTSAGGFAQGGSPFPTFGSPFHDQLIQTTGVNVPLSTDVDYYTVMRDSESLDIMFYKTGGDKFFNSYGPNGAFPTWNDVTVGRTVDGQVGNPTPDDFTGINYLFALRNTAEWLP